MRAHPILSTTAPAEAFAGQPLKEGGVRLEYIGTSKCMPVTLSLESLRREGRKFS